MEEKINDKLWANAMVETGRKNAHRPRIQGNKEDRFLFLALFGFLLLVEIYWRYTWDDSAITLAFSRNLVRYGDIIPSQFSDRVEGYSTFLWMMINAVFFRFGSSEENVLLIAKIISTVFSLGNILLFWRLVKANIHQPFYQYLILFLYTINLQTITSATFGMETALYAFLVLVAYLLYKKRDQSQLLYIAFTLLSSLLILIRHEGPLFLVPFVIETVRERPRDFYKEPFLYFWGGTFLTYHIWHFAYFGELLTNPMLAKRQPPYLPKFDTPIKWLFYYLSPFLRALALYPTLLMLPVFNFIFLRNHKREHISKDPLFWGIAFTGIFIMLITGKSWLDADRLSYPALPFLLLVVVQYLDCFSIKDGLQNSGIMFTVILGTILFINIAAVSQAFIGDERFRINTREVEKIARLETLVQEDLRLDRMTLVSPDMGGLLLYHGDGKRVIDLGLLCNRELAKRGYEIVDSYILQEEKPEMIEIHDVWITPFVNSDLFYRDYSPVQVVEGSENRFIFLRNDLMQKLEGPDNVIKMYSANAVDIRPDIAILLKHFEYFWKITFTNQANIKDS